MKQRKFSFERWPQKGLVGCLLLNTLSVPLMASEGGVNNSALSTEFSRSALAQESTPKRRVVTGRILSAEDNEPIIGANVWLKNSSVGTVTDFDGNYSITIDGLGAVLTYSYIGMKSQDIEVSGRSNINITLAPDTEQLGEVVVVGFGTQRKESIVGAISTLNMAELNVPTANLSTALAGQLSGIVAMTRSGEPGKNGADFYIRGVSSFKGNSKPLVLVDGIERDLDLVDTEDIATFSILKDASASAVYGVRGANGVILITTRKGDEGKPKISVRAEAGLTSPTRMPNFVNSAQWSELYNEASGTKYYTQDMIDRYRNNSDPDLYPNVNWLDEMYSNFASNQRVNLSISGGGSVARYFISGSFYNEGSIFKNAGNLYDYNSSINYSRFNFRANIDFTLTKTTNLTVNMANIYENQFAPGSSREDIWGYAFNTSPNAFPVQYSDGSISGPATNSGNNPWNLLVHSGYREQFWNSSQSLIGLNQDLGMVTKGLTATVKFSWDAYNTSTQIRSKQPTTYHASGRDENGGLILNQIVNGQEELGYSQSTDGSMTTYLEGALNYSRLFADKHRVGALFLYNQRVHNLTQSGDKFLSLPYKNQGIAGRVTYGYDERYFAEVNMGYNGSENFARGHRFGFFPAVAAGWMMSNENWFEGARNVVDMIKFRASYGQVGNDDIGGGRWIYQSTVGTTNGWNFGSDNSQGGGGLITGRIENLNVSWETATKTNVGIEMSLLNKIRIQADYFNEHREGIFLQRAGLPGISGVTNIPSVNIGETLNRGFDGTVEYQQKVGKVNLTARGNLTYNRNELLNNDEPNWMYLYQNRVGKAFGAGGALQPFGLKAVGFFESQEDINNSPRQTFGEYRVGDIKYQDINGDGKIDAYDQVAIGYTNLPEITYGIGMTAQWKGIDVNLFFQGVSRVSFFTGGTAMQPFSSNNMGRAAINSDIYKHSWMTTNTAEQNAKALYPRLSIGGEVGSQNNYQNSTNNLRDGSFFRLKNFEMGYTLPARALNGTFINNLRFYVSGSNLFTFSKFKLWDPERGSGDGSGYPPNRIMTFGFTSNF